MKDKNYTRLNKHQIRAMSTDKIDDEIYGNNNILEGFEQLRSQRPLTKEEKQIENELTNEYHSLNTEKYKRL